MRCCNDRGQVKVWITYPGVSYEYLTTSEAHELAYDLLRACGPEDTSGRRG